MQERCVFLLLSLIAVSILFRFERFTSIRYDDLRLSKPKDLEELSSITLSARKYALLNLACTAALCSSVIAVLHFVTRLIVEQR